MWFVKRKWKVTQSFMHSSPYARLLRNAYVKFQTKKDIQEHRLLTSDLVIL